MAREVVFIGGIAEAAPVHSTEWSRPQEAWAEKDDDGEWLIRWRGHGGKVMVGAAQEAVLSEFMRLADASPDEVATFVGRWGPLDLCRHGVPNTHLPRRMMYDLDLLGAKPCQVPPLFPKGEVGERLERWHHFARQAHALHRVAQMVLRREKVPRELWRTMWEIYPQGPLDDTEVSRWPEPSEEDLQRLLAYALQRWLNMGDVGIHVRWEKGVGTIRYGGTGLAGALALQLALTCTGTGSFYNCSECDTPYTPTRQPRSGESNYCFDCRDNKVPERNRTRAYRVRKKEREESRQTRNAQVMVNYEPPAST